MTDTAHLLASDPRLDGSVEELLFNESTERARRMARKDLLAQIDLEREAHQGLIRSLGSGLGAQLGGLEVGGRDYLRNSIARDHAERTPIDIHINVNINTQDRIKSQV